MVQLDLHFLTQEVLLQLHYGFLTFIRIGSIFFFFPALGESFIPRRIILGLIVSISFALAPIAIGSMSYLPNSRMEMMLLILSEVFFGTFIGFFIRSVIFQIQVAGSAISSMTNISQMFQSGIDSMPALSQIVTYSALAVFVSGNLHLTAFLLIAEMYKVVPIGSFACISCVVEVTISIANRVFNGGTALAGGVIALFFVFNLFTGFVNKAMPQFMATFIFVPLTMLMTVYFIQDHLILILQVWFERSREFLQMNVPLSRN